MQEDVCVCMLEWVGVVVRVLGVRNSVQTSPLNYLIILLQKQSCLNLISNYSLEIKQIFIIRWKKKKQVRKIYAI